MSLDARLEHVELVDRYRRVRRLASTARRTVKRPDSEYTMLLKIAKEEKAKKAMARLVQQEANSLMALQEVMAQRLRKEVAFIRKHLQGRG